jgi:Fur family transcriptional regulator, zinc uptake regulator
MRSRRHTSVSLTQNELSVLGVLHETSRPLGAYQILRRLSDQGIASPTSVYRALKRLTEIGLVHHIVSLNAYMQCAFSCPGGLAMFAICDACGEVTEATAAEVTPHLSELAAGAGFTVRKMILEAHGLCQSCADLANPAQECRPAATPTPPFPRCSC